MKTSDIVETPVIDALIMYSPTPSDSMLAKSPWPLTMEALVELDVRQTILGAGPHRCNVTLVLMHTRFPDASTMRATGIVGKAELARTIDATETETAEADDGEMGIEGEVTKRE